MNESEQLKRTIEEQRQAIEALQGQLGKALSAILELIAEVNRLKKSDEH